MSDVNDLAKKWLPIAVGIGLAVFIGILQWNAREKEREREKVRNEEYAKFAEEYLRKQRDPVFDEVESDLMLVTRASETGRKFLDHLAAGSFETARELGSDGFRSRHTLESLKDLMSDHPKIASRDTRRLEYELVHRNGQRQRMHVTSGPADDTSLPLVQLRLIHKDNWLVDDITVEPGTPAHAKDASQ